MSNTKKVGKDELVLVDLFSDGEHYKEPVPVIVNGVRSWCPAAKRC